MVKLIVGLGNPGEQYKQNRHNVGFMFLDFLAHNTPFITDSMVEGHVVKMRTNEDNWILLKPQTYMNKSGQSVRMAVKKFLDNEHSQIINGLVVVHDDLDIPFGKFKIQTQGPKLHNGLESIENHLHVKDFMRIRIGVDARTPDRRIPGEAYVLQDFSTDEQVNLPALFEKIRLRLVTAA